MKPKTVCTFVYEVKGVVALSYGQYRSTHLEALLSVIKLTTDVLSRNLH
jgi:hypothetical protein